MATGDGTVEGEIVGVMVVGILDGRDVGLLLGLRMGLREEGVDDGLRVGEVGLLEGKMVWKADGSDEGALDTVEGYGDVG